MKSVEALWTARFGDVSAPDKWENGGVAVFETGRIFGGDGGTYYIGQYEIKGNKLGGKITITRYDERYRLAFGDIPSPMVAIIEAEMTHPDLIRGHMWPESDPKNKIMFDLKRRADLP